MQSVILTTTLEVSNTFNTYSDILYGVPQGSKIGLLLFNIYISDMFYDIDNCDTASYTDDSTYTNDFNLEKEIIELIKVSKVKLVKLELITNNLFEWFKNNHMKTNTDHCHSLVTRDTDVTVKIGEFDVQNSREEKLLGVKTDAKLSFENHVSFLCKKASQKLHALARVVNFLDLAKRKSLKKAFNCSLVWIFHSKQLNNQINKMHENGLKLVYKSNKRTFNDLLVLDNSVTINQRNLQIFATKIFKVKNRLAPEITTEVFEIKEPRYNLCSEASYFKRER